MVLLAHLDPVWVRFTGQNLGSEFNNTKYISKVFGVSLSEDFLVNCALFIGYLN